MTSIYSNISIETGLVTDFSGYKDSENIIKNYFEQGFFVVVLFSKF